MDVLYEDRQEEDCCEIVIRIRKTAGETLPLDIFNESKRGTVAVADLQEYRGDCCQSRQLRGAQGAEGTARNTRAIQQRRNLIYGSLKIPGETP